MENRDFPLILGQSAKRMPKVEALDEIGGVTTGARLDVCAVPLLSCVVLSYLPPGHARSDVL